MSVCVSAVQADCDNLVKGCEVQEFEKNEIFKLRVVRTNLVEFYLQLIQRISFSEFWLHFTEL